jgi:hypothetical protein
MRPHKLETEMEVMRLYRGITEATSIDIMLAYTSVMLMLKEMAVR